MLRNESERSSFWISCWYTRKWQKDLDSVFPANICFARMEVRIFLQNSRYDMRESVRCVGLKDKEKMLYV